MAAVAAVCMQEEEEREIQEAMVATGMSIYPDEYDAILYRRQRLMSLGNVSAPPMLNRSYRFSSVGGGGGYSSLLEPPRRFSFTSASRVPSIGGFSYQESRGRSGSEASRIFSNYPMGSSFGTDDYFMETDDDEEEEDAENKQEQSHSHHGDEGCKGDGRSGDPDHHLKDDNPLSNAENQHKSKPEVSPHTLYTQQPLYSRTPLTVSIYSADSKDNQGFLELPEMEMVKEYPYNPYNHLANSSD